MVIKIANDFAEKMDNSVEVLIGAIAKLGDMKHLERRDLHHQIKPPDPCPLKHKMEEKKDDQVRYRYRNQF